MTYKAYFHCHFFTRKFRNAGYSATFRLSFNTKTRELLLVSACGFQAECLRRKRFATIDDARTAWADWQGSLETSGWERGESSAR